MSWNQINENILCNSDYYYKINCKNSSLLYIQLQKLNKSFVTGFVSSFGNFFEEYLQINLVNSSSNKKNVGVELDRDNLELYCKVRRTQSGAYVNIQYAYIFNYTYTKNSVPIPGNYYQLDNNRKCIIIGYDNVSKILTLSSERENLFHFSFHEYPSSLTRELRSDGAFHLKIDKMRGFKHSFDFQVISSNFRPFIIPNLDNLPFPNPIEFALFDDFSTTLNNYYTTSDINVLSNELQLYLLRNVSPNGEMVVDVVDISGVKISYIYDIIRPIYNKIVVDVLNKLTYLLVPPIPHKYQQIASGMNDPVNIRYCSVGYTDAQIRKSHKFKGFVYHGGKNKQAAGRTRKIRSLLKPSF
jgi:hypothetical protein